MFSLSLNTSEKGEWRWGGSLFDHAHYNFFSIVNVYGVKWYAFVLYISVFRSFLHHVLLHKIAYTHVRDSPSLQQFRFECNYCWVGCMQRMHSQASINQANMKWSLLIISTQEVVVCCSSHSKSKCWSDVITYLWKEVCFVALQMIWCIKSIHHGLWRRMNSNYINSIQDWPINESESDSWPLIES